MPGQEVAPHDQVVVAPTVFCETVGVAGVAIVPVVKLAVQVLLAFIVIVWLAMPLQPGLPVQPANDQLESGVAVIVGVSPEL